MEDFRMGVKYNFKFSLFGSKVQKFNHMQMGIVIEKEHDVICVYGTTANFEKILCAIPLCHPKFLKGAEYSIEFTENQHAKISVKDIKILINYKNKKCSNNLNIHNYGSESWGDDVSEIWDDQLFNEILIK